MTTIYLVSHNVEGVFKSQEKDKKIWQKTAETEEDNDENKQQQTKFWNKENSN